MTIEVTEIMKMIPHRYPLLLVDRVLEVDDTSVEAIKNVTINEQFFQGHFPGHPIMPGVLIIEALAQASAMCVMNKLGQDESGGRVVYFTSIDSAKFRKPVVPGDTLHLHATITKSRGMLYKFDVQAKVKGEVVTEATIAAMIRDGGE